jgi:hypothetical protein
MVRDPGFGISCVGGILYREGGTNAGLVVLSCVPCLCPVFCVGTLCWCFGSVLSIGTLCSVVVFTLVFCVGVRVS